jgi:hypothetical protein
MYMGRHGCLEEDLQAPLLNISCRLHLYLSREDLQKDIFFSKFT